MGRKRGAGQSGSDGTGRVGQGERLIDGRQRPGFENQTYSLMALETE